MSDQNLSEEIINSESITENESIQSQDQSTLNDHDLLENVTDEIIEEIEQTEDNVEEEIINQEENEEAQENKYIVEENLNNEIDKVKNDSIEDETSLKSSETLGEEKVIEENTTNGALEETKVDLGNKTDISETKTDSLEEKNKITDNKNDITDNKNDITDNKNETTENENETNEDKNKINEDNSEKMNIDKKEDEKENPDDKEENKDENQKSEENKKFDKDDSLPPNKKSYSNSYRNSDKGYGRFPPRGHQYSQRPYDDWGRRKGMNYSPYYEKDRRHSIRGDFRGRDYRDFYDMRMGRDFRGFRDRDRDFDYPPKFYRGRDPRFFNKRDRDYKYKRDYYDDYNRGMDKEMRINNSLKECRVYVQNLSYDVTTEMLTRFMEKVGKVVSTEILTSPDGRSKGCAIVQYETPTEARRAISDLQDNQFQGRPIHIREDREGMQYSSQSIQDKSSYYDKQNYQAEGSSSNYPNNTPPKEQRIFVGNLDVNVTANDLRTLFEPAGVIIYADVFQKDRNQTSKHGIIGFQDSSSIKKAIEMFNGVSYRNRKLDVHEDRRGILPVRRFNSYKSDKNLSIHNAGHHPYPSSKPYPSSRGGKPYPGKYNNRQPPPSHHQNSQQKIQQPPLPPHPSNAANPDKSNGNNYVKNQTQVTYNQQPANPVTYPNQPVNQHNSQGGQLPYSQTATQPPYIQPMTSTTYPQTAQSTYTQPQAVQPAAGTVPLYAGYPMTDQTAAANSNIAYQSSYQTAAYYSSLSHQAQPVAIPTSQPVQQPYPVATNVDYNNIYSAYYGQASQVGASGYPMMTQGTPTATVQGQAGYTEGSTLPTTYNYY